jgi:acyl phosphate:glycerol-3-phosphate acyltransferase
MSVLPSAFFVVILSYLIGAIPFAYIVARLNGINIFEVGSGNMGTTNVIRAVGPVRGIGVLLLDLIKGIVAILIARIILQPYADTATVLAAIAAIVGHNWSVFAWMVTGKLRGGKGAATALGTFLMVAPIWLTVVMLAVGTTILLRTRYMSLAVLVMVCIAAPALVILSVVPASPLNENHLVYALALTGMIFYRFRDNIQRLRAGDERRVGERA